MKKYFYFLCFIGIILQAQEKKLSIDANLKSRFEYRHGYAELFPDDANPAAFINQRVRIEGNYQKDWLTLQLSAQQIYTWGENKQEGPTDAVSQLSLAEAWANMDLNSEWSIKLGRQSITYDDERILGALDWTQTGSFHDLFLLKYRKSNWDVDAGFAFNQQSLSLTGTLYKTDIDKASSYKTMLYLHTQKNWDKNQLSFLLLNNGFQNQEKKNGKTEFQEGAFYKHTTGTYFNLYPTSNFSLEGSAYYQFGKSDKSTDLSAYEFRIEPTFHINNWHAGIGYEVLSGNDYNKDSSKDNSFIPLYGTNHSFNGYMDYFYVGNYTGSVGLKDLYARFKYDVNSNGRFLLKTHMFNTQADLKNEIDSYLGAEVDLKFDYDIKEYMNLSLGYSHMFPSNTLKEIKNTTTDNVNNWFYVQLYLTPNLFNSSEQ